MTQVTENNRRTENSIRSVMLASRRVREEPARATARIAVNIDQAFLNRGNIAISKDRLYPLVAADFVLWTSWPGIKRWSWPR